MPKWLPLIAGMTLFVIVTIASVLYLVWGGVAGNQRGLVVTNLRGDSVVLTLDDGQTATFGANDSETLFAVKKRFPLTMRVDAADGTPLFRQLVEYTSLVDAEFRIAIGEAAILFPEKPKPR